MDEINLFSTLQPESLPDRDPVRQQARSRLDHALLTSKSTGSPTTLRRRVSLAAAGLVAAAAGAAIIVAVITPGKDSGSFVTSAWAVQRNPDGSVRITFKEVANPAGLQHALRADGIHARVMSPRMKSARVNGRKIDYLPCHYPLAGRWFAPARIQRAAVTWNPSGVRAVAVIHPVAMPGGSELFIMDTAAKLATVISRPAILKSDHLPPCTPVPAP